MKLCRSISFRSVFSVTICLVLWTFSGVACVAANQADSAGPARPAAGKVSPAFAQVVKLRDAGVNEEVVLGYIQNSQLPKPNADELIYLHEAGVSKNVLLTLLSKNNGTSKGMVTSAPTAAPPNGVTADAGRILAKPVYAQPSAAPSVIYVERPPVYVQPQPTVVYSSPIYYDYPYYHSYYGRSAISVGFSLGHHLLGHHGGHHSFGRHLFGHHGGHSFGHGGHSFGHGGHHSGHRGGHHAIGHSGHH